MEFNIQPLLVPKYAVRMKIDVNVVLNEKAIIIVSLYEEGSEFTPLDVKHITLIVEAYKKWGNDDTYIKDLVFEYLDMKPSQILENK
jgi:hypothetical protein